jgi:hypothetical protein
MVGGDVNNGRLRGAHAFKSGFAHASTVRIRSKDTNELDHAVCLNDHLHKTEVEEYSQRSATDPHSIITQARQSLTT